jgi:hypothetical protein
MSNYASDYLKAISRATLICGALAFAGPSFAAGVGIGGNGASGNGNGEGAASGAGTAAGTAGSGIGATGNGSNGNGDNGNGTQAANSGEAGKNKGAADTRKVMCANVMQDPDNYEDFIVTSCRTRM